MKTWLILLLIFLSFGANAQTVYGSQIDFRLLDSFKYEVRLQVYADCNDSDFVINTDGSFSVRSTQMVTPMLISPTLKAIVNITNHHDSISSCVTGASVIGIEQYTYLDTIDFNTTYDTMKSHSIILFQFLTTKMAPAANLGYSSKRQSYNYSELRLQTQVQKCKFSGTPTMYFGKNQAVFSNHQAPPNNGQDSVSYSWGCALTSWNQIINYNTPFSCNYPFSAYCPSGSPPCSSSWTNPPSGITLDGQTADLIFTATQSEKSDFVIEATIWQKDSNDILKKAAVLRRELIYVFDSVSNNNPPIVNGPYSYTVCAGQQLCFNVTSNDLRFIPAPPAPAPAYDSVKLSWDESFDSLGATFTIVSSTARLQTGQFCWTPTEGQASELPYSFKVRGIDNNGPKNAVSERSFRVLVRQRARSETEFNYLECGGDTIGVKFSMLTDSSFLGTTSYRMTILDTGHNIIFGSEKIRFNSSLNFLSLQQSDTLVGDTSGTFVIQSRINNIPLNCPSITYDTVTVDLRSPEVPSLLQDSIYCDVIQDTLRISGSWDNIQWNTGDSIALLPIDSPGLYIVELTDSCGHKYNYSANIKLLHSPSPMFADHIICPGDSIFTSYSDYEDFDILWSTGDTISNVHLMDSGQYFVSIDKYCGSTSDSFVLSHFALPEAIIEVDSSVCDVLKYSFEPFVGPSPNHTWFQDNRNKTDSVIYSYVDNQLVRLIVQNICASDTVFSQLKHVQNPELHLNNDSFTGCVGDSFIASTNSTYNGYTTWSTGDSTIAVKLFKSGTYYVSRTNHCASVSDSVFVDIDSVPNAEIRTDTTLCEGDELTLFPIHSHSGATVWWNNSPANDTINLSQGGQFRLTMFNRCGSNRDTVNITELSLPNVNIHAPVIICAGDTIALIPYPEENNHTTSWNGIVHNDSLKITQGGNYKIKVEGQCGVVSDSLTIYGRDIPNTNLGADLEVNLPFNLVLDAGIAETYLWHNNISTRTNLVSDTGMFWVKTTNICGENSDTILLYDNSPVSISSVSTKSQCIYPNPANDFIIVKTETKERKHIQILNSIGEVVIEDEMKEKKRISVKELAPGNYIFLMNSKAGFRSEKFVISSY